MNTDMLTASAVKKRGWTDGEIAKLLGEPDATKTNPHYKCAAPMRLYALTRVEAAEKTDAYTSKAEARNRRRVAKEKRDAVKEEARLKHNIDANNHNAQLPGQVAVRALPPYPELVKEALSNHRRQEDLRLERFGFVSERETPLDEKVTNYVRHRKTNYEFLLKSIRDRCVENDDVDAVVEYHNDVYFAIRAAVDRKVAAAVAACHANGEAEKSKW